MSLKNLLSASLSPFSAPSQDGPPEPDVEAKIDRRDPVTGSEELARTLWHSKDIESTNDPDYDREEKRDLVDNEKDANLVGSQLYEDYEGEPMHAITLDLDVPAKLVPSSTEGHFHLYIDVPMSWREYEAIIQALANAGVVEPGYAEVSIKRRQTFLRLPGVRKL